MQLSFDGKKCLAFVCVEAGFSQIWSQMTLYILLITLSNLSVAYKPCSTSFKCLDMHHTHLYNLITPSCYLCTTVLAIHTMKVTANTALVYSY